MLDTKALAAALLKTVQDWITPTIKQIDERFLGLDRAIKAIPAGAKGERGDKGEPGLNGKDGAPGDRGILGDKGERGEPGQKGDPGEAGARGRDGIDGKDGAPGDRGEAGQKGEAGELGEAGQKGDPGDKGDAGEQGTTGEPGQKGDQGPKGDPGDRGESGQKGDAGERGETGPKGDPGESGANGHPGEKGDKGDPGERGADGKSITPEDMIPVLETVVAKWALDFERRAADVLQRAVERLPAPKDGRDAFELEDLQAEHDGDGNVKLRFVRGELRKEFAIRLPRFKDCGVFSAGTEYRSGDGVTWGGSFFIAQKDAPAGKPGESDDWRLAVKRGRDGKDVKPPEPPRGPIKVG